jgi:uncharacterized membrane protein YhaH (DUF805 family)
MALPISSERFRFLFRQERGTIDERTWLGGTVALAATWLLIYLANLAADHAGGITKVGVTSLFVLATMVVAACYYFLSAKRFADRGRPRALAIVLPATGFVAAALSFMQPAQGGTFPLWLAYVADAALVAVAIWNIIELGFMAERR